MTDNNPIVEALRACRVHFIYAALFSGLINILYLAPSIYMLQVYDRVVSTRSGATLFLLTIILAFALATSAALDTVRMRLLQRASARVEILASSKVLDRMLARRGLPGVAQTQAMRDFDTVRQTLTGPAILALFDAPWAPIYILVCFLLHWMIGILALVSSLLLAFVAWRSERSTADIVKRASDRSSATYFAQDYSIRLAEVVRTMGMRRAIVDRHIVQRLETVALQGEAARTSGGYLAVTKFLRMFIQSCALATGALLAINGQISAGSIFASSLLISRGLQPIEQILGAMRATLQARAAYINLAQIYDHYLPDDLHTMLPEPKGRLSVEGVGLEIPGRNCVLANISFEAQPGEVIALVGPSGAGKSTLLRVLAGGLLPSSGVVRVDGASYMDWDLERLARHIGYVPQEASLFPGSIHDNIARFQNVGDRSTQELDDAVVKAAQAAGAHELVLRLPQGYETLVGPGGQGLSAGQMQRIALARALFGEPKILLLDEPNAHLDGSGEAVLYSTLAEQKARGVLAIVSAHRTGIIRVADKILVLDEGRLRSFGTTDEVLRPRRDVVAGEGVGALNVPEEAGASKGATA